MRKREGGSEKGKKSERERKRERERERKRERKREREREGHRGRSPHPFVGEVEEGRPFPPDLTGKPFWQ